MISIGKWLALFHDRIRAPNPKVEVRALLHESARLGDGLLIQISHFAQELRGARLRRFRIHRQRGGYLRSAVFVDRDFALRVKLRQYDPARASAGNHRSHHRMRSRKDLPG